jgi:hypothetical protein
METEQIVDSQVTDTQEPTQEAPEAGQETQAEQTQQPAGMTPRQQRRNVFNENLALKKENERLMREMAERMGDSMASRVGQEVGRAVERFAPPRPAPQDLAFEEYRDAARSLNPEDPKSLRRFADAQTKLVNAGLNVEDLVRAEIQKAMPVQRPPEIQRLIMEFPWVEEGDNSDGVAYHFKRLIRDRDRNSAAVRIATLARRPCAWPRTTEYPLATPGTPRPEVASRRQAGAMARPLRLRGRSTTRRRRKSTRPPLPCTQTSHRRSGGPIGSR